MDDKAKVELFERAPIPKAVMTMAIPTITSSLVMVIYNLEIGRASWRERV